MEKVFKMNDEFFEASYAINGNSISISIDHIIDYKVKWEAKKANTEKYFIWSHRDLMNPGTMFKAFEGFHFFRDGKRYEVLGNVLPNKYHTIKCQEILDVKTVKDWDEREDIFGNVDAINPRDRIIVNRGSEYLWFRPETIISGIKGLSDERKKELQELTKFFNSFDSVQEFISHCKEENEKKIRECKKEFISSLHYKYNEEEIKTILQTLNLHLN